MTADIEANLKAFLGARLPGARYASFDYCFNYFQDAHVAGDVNGNRDLSSSRSRGAQSAVAADRRRRVAR